MTKSAPLEDGSVGAQSKGLVIRRRKASPGNKIVVRLSPDVPRDADLNELMREGLIIEFIDIEQVEEREPIAVLGIKAHEAFRIDRDERVLRPRPEKERAQLPDAHVPLPDPKDVETWSLDDHDCYIDAIRGTQARIRYYTNLAKHDVLIASERGWSIKTNDNHMHWLIIREEQVVLKEQADALAVRLAAARDSRRKRNDVVQNELHKAMSGRFMAVAKRTLDDETFRAIKEKCSE